MNTTPRRQPLAQFLPPRAELAQCILGGFLRDTRGCALRVEQRFNHFAASPLCALSLSFDGAWRLMSGPGDFAEPSAAPLMPPALFSGPQDHPTSSWNDGDIYAISVVFYPDAMAALFGVSMERFANQTVPLDHLPHGTALQGIKDAIACRDALLAYETLQEVFAPLWQEVRPQQSHFGRMIGDWSRALVVNAALSNPGRSLRQLQRRVKAMAGQPHKRVQTFAKSEQAFVLALQEERKGRVDIAGIAADAGYSDQSHMGRNVRAQTGFTPAELLRGVQSDEAFWSYRLMAERY